MRVSRILSFVLAALVGLVCVSEARAEEPPASDTTYWYGWQGLVSDSTSIALVGVGLALPNTVENDKAEHALIIGGGVLYLLGAPASHFLNGESRRGAASLGLRAGLPLVGALIGYYGIDRGSNDDGTLQVREAMALVGAGVGGVVALGLDHLILGGWHEREPRRSFAWGPTVAPTSSGSMTLGVAGVW